MAGHIHSLSINTILELVDLAIAHVVVHIRKRVLAANMSPSLLLFLVLGPVEAQASSEEYLDVDARAEGEELGVDIEGHGRLVVGRGRDDARHAVVLALVVVRHRECVLEELGIARG